MSIMLIELKIRIQMLSEYVFVNDEDNPLKDIRQLFSAHTDAQIYTDSGFTT